MERVMCRIISWQVRILFLTGASHSEVNCCHAITDRIPSVSMKPTYPRLSESEIIVWVPSLGFLTFQIFVKTVQFVQAAFVHMDNFENPPSLS